MADVTVERQDATTWPDVAALVERQVGPGRRVRVATGQARPRDSVGDAISHGYGVLAKPAYLWVPVVLGVIAALPLLVAPGYPARPTAPVTEDDLNAFVQAFVQTLILTTALAVLLQPIASSVTYRLGAQYSHGEGPRPFPPGFVNLAWRFFLQGLVLTLLFALGLVAVGAFVAGLQAVVGLPLAVLLVGGGAFILYVGVVARLLIAPVLLLTGAGPIESIQGSWRMTSGHLGRAVRWLIVTGLAVGIVSTLVNLAVGSVIGAVGLQSLDPIVGAAVAAPFSMISAIVWIDLHRLLSSEAAESETIASTGHPPIPEPADG